MLGRIGIIGVSLLSVLSVSLAAPSVSQAKQIAAQVLRDVIDDVTALDTKTGNFLLVAHREFDGAHTEITLLRKVGLSYVRAGEYGEHAHSFLGEIKLTDLNRDGRPEVYLSRDGGGTGGSFHDFVLVDTARGTVWKAGISVSPDQRSASVEYDTALLEPPQRAALTFLQQKVEAHPMFKITLRGPTLVQQWKQAHGGFVKNGWSKTTIKPNPRPLTHEECLDVTAADKGPSTYVKVGNIEYVAMFKGAVWAIDRAQKQCYVVYMPETVYDWIFPMEFKSGRLVLHDRTTYAKIVYYDPKTKTLSR